MALQRVPWAVNGPGVQHSATLARQANFSNGGSQTGIAGTTSLVVSAGSTPGPFVNVSSGSGTITYAQGRANQQDRAYAAFKDQSVPVRNDAQEQVPIEATTSAGGRTDLVCVEINDPEAEGTADTVDYSTHEFVRFRVIQGVGSNVQYAHQLPVLERPILPLARVTIPASTSTITNDMITDVRHMAYLNTRRTDLIAPANPSGGNIEIPSSVSGWVDVMEFTDIQVPQWATRALLTMSITHLYGQGGAVGGAFRLAHTGQSGTGFTASSNFVEYDSFERFQVHAAGNRPLAAITAGATVRVKLQIQRLGSNRPGTIIIPDASNHTSMAFGAITFEEAPRFDASSGD